MAGRPCYLPAGSYHDGLVACNISAAESHCCSAGSACLSNGFCLVQNGTFSNRLTRAGCTDRGWQSSACPQYCTDTNPTGGATLFMGPQTDTGTFCCNDLYDTETKRCRAGVAEPFDLPSPFVMNRIDGGEVLALTATDDAAASTRATATVTRTATSHAHDVASEAGIGLGVGIPLLIALITALVFLFRERKKTAALERQAASSKSSSTVQYAKYEDSTAYDGSRVHEIEDQGHRVHMLPAESNERREIMGRPRPAEMEGREFLSAKLR